MPKSLVITLRDIARECGCSPATVSITLNDAPLASLLAPETKQRIQEVARRLEYRPNLWARLLHERRSRLLGVIASSVEDPQFAAIFRGIEASVHSENYLALLTDSRGDMRRLRQNIDMLHDRRVEGFVMIIDKIATNAEFLADLKHSHLPVVILGRTIQNAVSTVSADDAMGARFALALVDRFGHRDIAFIRGPRTTPSDAEWWRGIRGYAKKAQLQLDERCVVKMREPLDPKSTFEAGVDLTRELLRRGRRFTALMAFEDMAALGAVHALRSNGVQVPEECSVMGFGDIPQAAMSVPPLSTVRCPMESVGAIGIEILLEAIRLADRESDVSVVQRKVPTEVVIRESLTTIKSTR
jgi:LacI family transcriptional regulator, galactose operon repressor